MSPIKSIKLFFAKDASEYMDGSVDPFEFHKCLYFFLKMFRVIEGPLPKWTLFTPLFVGFCGSVAAFLCFLGMMHRLESFEIPLVTESGTYFIVMMYKLFILSCSKTDKLHYNNLLKAMKEDFYDIISGTNSKYREKFFKNQLYTRKASIICAIFIGGIAYSMIVCATLALVFYLLTHESGDRTSRPLPFPLWLPGVDFGKSPCYEISLFFLYLCVISECCSYIFMMLTQVVWVRQITSKADVIIWNIEDLFEDIYPTQKDDEKSYFANLIQSRMRHIIMMHQSMYRLLDDYSGVYKKLLMFEQTLCAPVTCLTAFSFVEKLESGEFQGILLILCIGIIVLVFIPNYMCTFLALKLSSIGDACWETPFWNAGPVIRPYMVLIMQRSMRRLPIQTAGFKAVSIETFASKMASAYSAFNMLRQAKF